MVLNGVLSSGTEVDIKELWQKEAIRTLKCGKNCFADRTTMEDLADRTAQK